MVHSAEIVLVDDWDLAGLQEMEEECGGDEPVSAADCVFEIREDLDNWPGQRRTQCGPLSLQV